ncbi:MAG: hypothetical protein ACXVIM_05210, partial [Acidimicrobiia bacterium]
PSGGKVTVTVDGSGYAAPFTVKARGFEPYANVFIEQCNGRPPSAENWAPSLDCDLGSAPAAAIADANGVATFAANDPNHALYPFVGPGPEVLFNCLSAKGASPGNGMPDFRDCQLRISTSNTAATDDQVFLAMRLPEGARTGAGKPTFPSATATPAQNATAPATVSKHSGSGAGKSSTNQSASSESGSGSSSFPTLPVLLAIAVAAIGGAFFFLHKRRSGRVAA